MHEDLKDCLQGFPGVLSNIVGRARVSDFDWWGEECGEGSCRYMAHQLSIAGRQSSVFDTRRPIAWPMLDDRLDVTQRLPCRFIA